MLILELWGVSFHAAVVLGLGKDFLFKSALGHCERSLARTKKKKNEVTVTQSSHDILMTVT